MAGFLQMAKNKVANGNGNQGTLTGPTSNGNPSKVANKMNFKNKAMLANKNASVASQAAANIVNGNGNPSNKSKQDPYSSDMFSKVKVFFSSANVSDSFKQKYNLNDNEIYVLTLHNLAMSDVQKLLVDFRENQDPATIYAKIATTRENTTKDGVSFLIRPEMVDAWRNGVSCQKLMDILKDSGNYDEVDKNGVSEIDKVKKLIDRKMLTKQEIENEAKLSELSTRKLISKFLSDRKNPELLKLIGMLNVNNVMKSVATSLGLPVEYGHTLSMKNAALIIGSGGQATFILPERTWIEKFHRRVDTVNGKEYRIRVPHRSNYTGRWKNDTAINMGGTTLNSTQDVLSNIIKTDKSYNDLSTQQKFNVNTIANKQNTGGYYFITEYDISDTQWDPSLGNDVWNDEVGLSNNIINDITRTSEILNQQAQDEFNNAKRKISATSTEGGDVKDADTLLEEKTAAIYVQRLLDYSRKIGNKSLNVAKVMQGDHVIDFVNMLNEVYKYIADNGAGYAKKEDIEEFANDATFMTCVLTRIGMGYVKDPGVLGNGIKYRIQHRTGMANIAMDEEEYIEQLMAHVEHIIGVIDKPVETTAATDNSQQKAALEENINLNDFSEFKKKFLYYAKKYLGLDPIGHAKQAKLEAQKEKMNESFYKMLDRMDNYSLTNK